MSTLSAPYRALRALAWEPLAKRTAANTAKEANRPMMMNRTKLSGRQSEGSIRQHVASRRREGEQSVALNIADLPWTSSPRRSSSRTQRLPD